MSRKGISARADVSKNDAIPMTSLHSETKLQKAFDGSEPPTYMPSHRSDGPHGSLLRSPETRRRTAPLKRGSGWRRAFALFDIVGLDEGTCGRRLRVQRFQGVGNSVKAKSLYNVLHVSIRKNYCAERLLEMSGLIRAFHLDLVVHKLESLIMAQNERWRHA